METITDIMKDDHHRCDLIFAQVEKLISDNHWTEGEKKYQEFQQAIKHHFNMEESVLFPTFEQQTGMFMGPTQVMRSEHEQIRELLEEMTESLQEKDQEDYLGLSETLLVIMQQHNAKEEMILYPMTDRELGDNRKEILQRMNDV